MFKLGLLAVIEVVWKRVGERVELSMMSAPMLSVVISEKCRGMGQGGWGVGERTEE
jgi:hypothetical protein